MICTRCAQAADQQLPRTEHCDTEGGPGTACCCQHRTDRYQPKPPAEVVFGDGSLLYP